MSEDTGVRIRRDNLRDAVAVANLYVNEDSDRGFMARQVDRLAQENGRLLEALSEIRGCLTAYVTGGPGLSDTLGDIQDLADAALAAQPGGGQG